MADEPLVRVIILNYNQPELTIACANSVLAQAYGNYEVVIVDNGSKSDKIKYLEDNKPGEAIVIKSEINLGYARGNNLGCSAIKGSAPEYYFVLNNDTIIEDRFAITKLVDIFKLQDESCAIVAPLVDTITTNEDVFKQIQGRKLLSTADLIISQSAFLSRTPYGRKVTEEFLYKEKMPLQANSLYEVDCVSGAAFLIKSSCCKNNEIFDPNTFLYFEEIILGEELLKQNLKSFINTGVVVRHYQGMSSGKRGKKQPFKMFKYGLDSEIYFYKKYRNSSYPTVLLVKALKYLEYYFKAVIYG
jgi:GT2 family glycosyltransferase